MRTSPTTSRRSERVRSRERSGLRESLNRLQRPLDLLVGKLIGDQLPGEVGVVGRQIDHPVAAEVEEDRPLLPLLLRALRLRDDRRDGVVGLRGGDDPLGPRPLDARVEGCELVVGRRLDQTLAGEGGSRSAPSRGSGGPPAWIGAGT